MIITDIYIQFRRSILSYDISGHRHRSGRSWGDKEATRERNDSNEQQITFPFTRCHLNRKPFHSPFTTLARLISKYRKSHWNVTKIRTKSPILFAQISALGRLFLICTNRCAASLNYQSDQHRKWGLFELRQFWLIWIGKGKGRMGN